MEIKIENISFGYMSKRRTVLNDFSLKLEPDGIIGLIGRNGQGKTTLMKLLAGQNLPDSGRILYDGEMINKIDVINRIVYASDNLNYMNRKLGNIVKDYKLMYKNFDLKFAEKLLELFGLNNKTKIDNLSKGQNSLFNFCVAMATRSELTILDEPVAGVDTGSRRKVYDIILRDYIEHPRTILISSHMLGEMENMLSGIVIIDNKKLIYKGTIDEIRNVAYKITGDKEKIENYITGKKVLYKNIGALSSTAVIEEEITDNIKELLSEDDLILNNLTAEEYYVFKTAKADKNMEELWKN